MIRALIFDCFGVLVDPVFKSFWGKLGAATQEKIREIDERADIGEISDEIREIAVAKLLAAGGLDGENEIKTGYFNSARRENLLQFIRESRADFKTALLSNVASNIDRIFSLSERRELFDDEVLSYQVHLTKPDPRIYQMSAERLGVEPRECVFVDDKIANVRAAENVGMRGILYQDFDEFRADLNEILGRANA